MSSHDDVFRTNSTVTVDGKPFKLMGQMIWDGSYYISATIYLDLHDLAPELEDTSPIELWSRSKEFTERSLAMNGLDDVRGMDGGDVGSYFGFDAAAGKLNGRKFTIGQVRRMYKKQHSEELPQFNVQQDLPLQPAVGEAQAVVKRLLDT